MFTRRIRQRKRAEPDLGEILGDYRLPTFPSIYMESLQLVRDADAPAARLGDVLASDPGLTVRLLQAVNSAAYGFRQVKSVHHAVTLLGRAQVESLLLSLATHVTLPSHPARGFEPARFWKTAARRAATARALAERVDPAAGSACFTAALLQDMALPMLSCALGEVYGGLLERWHQGESELHRMEHDQFGWDHARVAALMCAEWEFPETITHAIGAHHDRDDVEGALLVPVRLAACIPEVNEEPGIEQLVQEARATIGLESDAVRELVAASFRDAQGIAAQFA